MGGLGGVFCGRPFEPISKKLAKKGNKMLTQDAKRIKDAEKKKKGPGRPPKAQKPANEKSTAKTEKE